MKPLKEIDCTKGEAERLTNDKFKFYSAECGGWLPENIIKILFFKVVELENRIEQIEGAKE